MNLEIGKLVRKARVSDVPYIVALINEWASRNEMLPRSLNQCYQNIRDFVVAEENGQFAGCGALHVLWGDMGEIRSLAVTRPEELINLGRPMVDQLLTEARELGLPRVMVFTYKPDFFEELDFVRVPKESLPRRVWAECIDCLKFPHCDETALWRDL